MIKLNLIDNSLLEQYKKKVPENLDEILTKIARKESSLTKNNFDFYSSIASVFSSKIEGEQIELDSYLKHKYLGIEYLPDYTKRIDDLFSAYSFASKHMVSRENIFKAHEILTKNILVEAKRRKIRTAQMFVADKVGNIVYVAADAAIVKEEMDNWFADLEILTSKVLENEEALFYASMLHLTFVNIHPFNDGNGRTPRLIEKWFLSNYIGKKAWLSKVKDIITKTFSNIINRSIAWATNMQCLIIPKHCLLQKCY